MRGGYSVIAWWMERFNEIQLLSGACARIRLAVDRNGVVVMALKAVHLVMIRQPSLQVVCLSNINRRVRSATALRLGGPSRDVVNALNVVFKCCIPWVDIEQIACARRALEFHRSNLRHWFAPSVGCAPDGIAVATADNRKDGEAVEDRQGSSGWGLRA